MTLPISAMDTRNNLISSWRSVVSVKDEDFVDIILGTLLHSYSEFSRNPIWLLVVAPPSSGKTLLAWQPFQSLKDKIYNLGKITPSTFITGFKDGTDLLPLLNDKLVLQKDMTMILSDKHHAIQIMDQLRQIYDGEYAANYGGDKANKTYNAMFDMISCITTSAARTIRESESQLGERMLTIRLHSDKMESVKASINNIGKEGEINEILMRAINLFVLQRKDDANKISSVSIDRNLQRMIYSLVRLSQMLRVEVPRNYKGDIDGWPVEESGSRIASILTTIAKSIAVVHGKSSVDHSIYNIIARICYDIIPYERMCMLELLLRNGSTSLDRMAKVMSLPKTSLNRKMEEMFVLNICHYNDKSKSYVIDKEIRDLLEATELIEAGPTSGDSDLTPENIVNLVRYF